MGRVSKSLAAVWEISQYPVLARRLLTQAYNERIVRLGKVPTYDMPALIGPIPEVRLVDFVPEGGNVSPLELLCLCMFVRAYRPQRILELGTFNGNTTLQFAANIEDGAHVTTVDLPPDSAPSTGNNEHDAVLVKASSRQVPRFVDSAHAPRITQRYGDTLKLDFSQLTDSQPDFIFIDAGHTDECVRNDTEKSLAVLRPGGTLIWHDYCQDWPDVFGYLNELGEKLPLRRVAGTNLVVYRREFSSRL